MVLQASSIPRVRVVREARGLSQRELARRLEIDHSAVSRIERGLMQPWPNFRLRVADVLGVDEALIFDAPERQP